MVKVTFNWDSSTWKEDYRAIFELFKTKLQEATAIFYPDYSLDWILRTDASLHGVGAVLLQIVTAATSTSDPVYQPISFASQKFSPQATRWSTIEQEAYGIYFGVKTFSYYLMCKSFILETDHNNLLWIEASAVPKVIRWRIYLQSFSFMLRHIPGKQNVVADWLSRAHATEEHSPLTSNNASVQSIRCAYNYLLHLEADSSSATYNALPPLNQFTDSVLKIFHQCHCNRNLHGGTRATWQLMNQNFPGHNIPYRTVSELVASCPVCQKDRLGMAPADTIEPIVRTLKPPYQRALIGADTLTITPVDKHGRQYLINIVVLLSKLVYLYPATNNDAKSVATAIFLFCCHYGMFDSLITDPGSEFDNEVVKHLNSWFGINHRFSLVDRHESNGVEATNREVQRYLRALTMDERINDRWSEPHILGLIQFHINSRINSETGVIPFHAHFGTHDNTYLKLPDKRTDMQRVSAYIKLLDKDLQTIRDISDKVSSEIARERTSKVPLDKQNKFQPGDFVLWQINPSQHKETKLSPRFFGPFEVIDQVKNDVTCRHVNLGFIKVFHVNRLKIFHGALEDAKRVAIIDNDQFLLNRFIAYRGEPLTRQTLEFEVEFADGTIQWQVWSKDLSETVQFEDYCRSRPELSPLLYKASIAAARIKELNKTPITEVKPGVVVYVDLRSWGATFYKGLDIPDKYHTTYLVKGIYGSWKNKTQTLIETDYPVFKETYIVNHDFVKRYGSNTTFKPSAPAYNEILVDDAFVNKYPSVIIVGK